MTNSEPIPDKLLEAEQLNGMGAVFEKKGEFKDAQQYYEESLALYEEIYGTEHYTIALVCKSLSRVLRAQGKSPEASLMEDHAAMILKKREDGPLSERVPLGGSSAFFELLGNAYTRHAEPDDSEDAGDNVSIS